MKKVLILAGEASGDRHAAELIEQTKLIDSNIFFYGLGSSHMRAAGANIIVENRNLAVIGIFELLTNFKRIRQIYNQFKKILETDKPDLLILVDFPAFNLRIVKHAKKHHIKTLYFISPQLWAWKPGRIKIIKKYVDKMAVIFPFEKNFYQKYQVDAVYVGNPLVENVKPSMSATAMYQMFGLSPANQIIAILPGSRKSEIKYCFDTLLATVALLHQKRPSLQFVLPIADSLDNHLLTTQIKAANLPIKIIPKQLYNILQISDGAIVVSGTVTLEVALMGVPLVIIYKLNFFTYCIARLLVKIKMFGLCNIIAEKKIAPELLQGHANPEKISAELLEILDNPNKKQRMQQELSELKQSFQKAEESIAGVIFSLI